MKRRILSVLLMAAMATALMAGCSSDTNTESEYDTAVQTSDDSAKTIAIVPWDMAETFAVDFSHEAQAAIEEKGWKAVIMDPKGDWAQEYTVLENLITQGIDGIIYTAIDSDGANEAVEKIQAAGIPIVGYDCLSSAGKEDAAVRYDDYQGGQMAAEQAMEALNKKENAKIIIFEDDPSISSSTLRVNGFVDYMEENFPEAEIIKNRTQDKTADGCYIWATDMITAHADTDAFFCYWSEASMATYNALQDADKQDVFVIGYDATTEQQDLMKKVGEDCKLYASPGMSPTKMADQCVTLLSDIMDGSYQRNGAEDIYEMTPVLLTAKNAESFNIND